MKEYLSSASLSSIIKKNIILIIILYREIKNEYSTFKYIEFTVNDFNKSQLKGFLLEMKLKSAKNTILTQLTHYHPESIMIVEMKKYFKN